MGESLRRTGQVQLYIIFRSNSADLDIAAAPVLSELRDALVADAGLRLRLTGHTDSTGKAVVNGPLSQKRAESVRQWLVASGVAPDRLAAAGKEIFAVPAARARHFGGASLEHVGLARFVDVWYRNMWLYAKKWFTAGEAESLRWMIIAGMMLRCVASVVGFANGNGRWPSFRAYAGVAKKAFNRWDP